VNKKIYVFDLDGTIARTNGSDYPNSQPIKGVVEIINRLYSSGHTIKIFTARGAFSGKDWKEFTEKQLKAWGLNYHLLIMGKPHGDYYIDDKAINALEWRAMNGGI
jgi:hydroxymethylpyrimidine pyrophosphatase-like HAD family hydrolase